MNRYRILYSKTAIEDLKDIASYLYSLTLNKSIASQKIKTIRKAIDYLADFPYSCPEYEFEAFKDSKFRFLTAANYNALYSVNDELETVTIVRVYYGKRDPNKIAYNQA
ncbi:MAG: type II toxin-antitoxin system RelE/ParE family toxin [Ruminococcus sp.]|nr:type II toxin-antitoxin system RelE/ParE family toxin [Ruminococcus sp.]